MLKIRKSEDRGAAHHGWLNSFHTFSFANYYNPQEMGFGPLRVINQDKVEAQQGFGTHGHRDMEIISYVTSGALEHKDDFGNGSVLKPGFTQKMSAGSGVRHSEFNHSAEEPVEFLQIWIEPNATGGKPDYEERYFDASEKKGKALLIASPTGESNSLSIKQDAFIYASILTEGDVVHLPLKTSRSLYLHLVKGSVHANGLKLSPGDGLKVTHEELLELKDADNAEVLIFDLPYGKIEEDAK